MLPVTTLSTWAVAAGGQALRGLVLSGVGWLLALPLLVSLEAGLIAMMLFEPMRGFLRRAQYLFLTYSDTDPIHIVTPIVTMLAFAMLLQRRKLETFRETPLAGLVSILGLIYFLEIFAFGLAAGAANYLRRGGWFLAGAMLTLMLLLTGQRTAMFGLILGSMVLLLLGARTWRAAFARVLLALAPVLLIAVLVKAPPMMTC
jgi:hypothetical protein